MISGAPVGMTRLFIDGSTAQREGMWPTVSYDLVTIPGTDNTVGMPIHLLPLDTAHGVHVDQTTGRTLRLPEMPGFALEIAPGAATFLDQHPCGDGTLSVKCGTVTATVVHADKMPMAPGFGQQPRFVVTIQPTGTVFDPPAALTIPNVEGLTPREITDMYSFDHDLGAFVSIGPGTVSEDGTVLRSNPGVGVLKGGWHCGGNPATGECLHHCADCLTCPGLDSVCECVEDITQDGNRCDDNECKECQLGRCEIKEPQGSPCEPTTAVEVNHPVTVVPGLAGVHKGASQAVFDGIVVSTRFCVENKRYKVRVLSITIPFFQDYNTQGLADCDEITGTGVNYCLLLSQLRVVGNDFLYFSFRDSCPREWASAL